MIKGSSPGDGGNLLLDNEEYNKITNQYPSAVKYMKKYMGAEEFLHGKDRFCIYVEKEDYQDANSILPFQKRFEKVQEIRAKSKKEATQKKANVPYEFDENKYRESDMIIIPQTTSELRDYVPIGFLGSEYVVSNAARLIYDAEAWMFGLLTSKIHNIWIQAVAGRLETRIQYSNTLCYNTFPFPSISDKQKEIINLHVFEVLDERAKHPSKTLAQLYDPDKMPKGLKEAHHQLDLAIERCYRLKPFENDTERLEYLFKMYEEMTTKNSLLQKEKKTNKAK